ncbi:hypothetical protein ABI_18100 [Asticcacaulis biprosthecium C19]|uniref:Uncharacterized protein n=1 Tax=Asticcacaulis biprosthecium C19 TaxID=715226 RepID=F4QKR7_9CAUL|nr:hypothetical protein ABI_18100 [Asticcacaulis biprosthecium C19]
MTRAFRPHDETADLRRTQVQRRNQAGRSNRARRARGHGLGRGPCARRRDVKAGILAVFKS